MVLSRPSAENCELFDLLDTFHDLNSREAKDRIYALGGLASDMKRPVELMPPKFAQGKIPLVPDYSLSDDEVFRQVALQRIQAGKIFMTLAYAGALRPRDGSRTLPSWTPDFWLPKYWQIMFKENSKSQSNPNVDLSSDGFITLKAEVDTPQRQLSGNWWNSCMVKSVLPEPKTIEPSGMIQFIRECLHWIHSIPTLASFSEKTKQSTLCDVLLTVAAKFGDDDDELGIIVSDGILGLVAELKVPPSFLPKASVQDRLMRWLPVSILDDKDCEGKFLEVIGQCLCNMFRAVAGRCLFMRNTITVSEQWGSDERGGWKHYDIGLFGVGPGDLVTGDVILRFNSVEEGFS